MPARPILPAVLPRLFLVAILSCGGGSAVMAQEVQPDVVPTLN